MLQTVHDILWGIPSVACIAAFGIYFTVKSRFRQVRKLPFIIRRCARGLGRREGGISAAASMATALGGTVGIGSIAGVGLALETGGAGSVFWMWVTGFLGCMLKYAETYVAVRYREHSGGIAAGGAMYALRSSGKRRTAAAFALLCVAASFGTGGLTQSHEVAVSAAAEGVSPAVTGAVFALCVLAAVWGGRKAIARFCAVAVPAASLIYLICVVALILMRASAIPRVFANILGSAFGIRQIAGGAGGAALAAAIRTGVVRGVFSSECGMGSSPIVHAANETADPQTQGDWGVLEVCADIFVFSTLTAIALLAYGTDSACRLFGFLPGGCGDMLYLPLVAVFGVAAAVGWCFYAESAIAFLVPENRLLPALYRLCAAACGFLGAVSGGSAIWNISDILNILMALPNLYLLFIKRKEICLCFTSDDPPPK